MSLGATKERSNLPIIYHLLMGLFRYSVPPKDSPSPCHAGGIFFALHRGSAEKDSSPPAVGQAERQRIELGVLPERMAREPCITRLSATSSLPTFFTGHGRN